MKKLVLILSFLALPLSSYAQDAFYVSGMLGITSPTYNDTSLETDAELAYGLRAGVLFNDHVAAGIFVNRYAGSDSGFPFAGTDADVKLTNIMAEVTYYMNEADENGLVFSGLLGVTQSNIEYSNTFANVDESDTAFGASVGYHFMVAPNFSLSPQVTYIHTSADNAYSELSGMVNLTLWL